MAKNSKSSAATRAVSPKRAGKSPSVSRSRKAPHDAPVSAPAAHGAKKPASRTGARTGMATVTDFTFYTNPTLTLICLPPRPRALFSLDDAARLTGVHPDLLRYYNQVGLVETQRTAASAELSFDEDALQEVRRIEHYRRHLGVGRRALPLICELQRESERLHIELRFLQAP